MELNKQITNVFGDWHTCISVCLCENVWGNMIVYCCAFCWCGPSIQTQRPAATPSSAAIFYGRLVLHAISPFLSSNQYLSATHSLSRIFLDTWVVNTSASIFLFQLLYVCSGCFVWTYVYPQCLHFKKFYSCSVFLFIVTNDVDQQHAEKPAQSLDRAPTKKNSVESWGPWQGREVGDCQEPVQGGFQCRAGPAAVTEFGQTEFGQTDLSRFFEAASQGGWRPEGPRAVVVWRREASNLEKREGKAKRKLCGLEGKCSKSRGRRIGARTVGGSKGPKYRCFASLPNGHSAHIAVDVCSIARFTWPFVQASLCGVHGVPHHFFRCECGIVPHLSHVLAQSSLWATVSMTVHIQALFLSVLCCRHRFLASRWHCCFFAWLMPDLSSTKRTQRSSSSRCVVLLLVLLSVQTLEEGIAAGAATDVQVRVLCKPPSSSQLENGARTLARL